MRILLVASSRSMAGFDMTTRLPNLGLNSIAGNLDRDLCEVKVVDLVVSGSKPRKYFQQLLSKYQPDIVGFSCMIFQYDETLVLIKLTKQFNRDIKVVLGGYHATVTYDEMIESDDMQFIDFIVRKEGEIAFNELVKALGNGGDFSQVPNLSYLDSGSVVHTADQNVLDIDQIKLPDRDSRLIRKGFHFLGYPADVSETSRGCAYDCNFCSIGMMYGNSYRTFGIERILEDVRDARGRGAKAIFFIDDNITLNGKRFKEVCEAIIDAGLNNIIYITQASVRGLKETPGLAETMVRAGFKYIFLGIESASNETLEFLNKSNQLESSDAYEVVAELQEYGAIVIGGFILGNPDDTEEDIWANYEYAKALGIDIPGFVILTPYPKTAIREELLEMGLITNIHDYSTYDQCRANIRTKHISSERLYELRNELDKRYLIDTGKAWSLVRQHPRFATKMILEQLIRRPGKMLGYLKGFSGKT